MSCEPKKGCCGGAPCGPPAGAEDKVHSSVQEFYTKAQQSSDLSSNAPCSASCPLDSGSSAFVSEAMKEIHADVVNSYFGCGLPFPDAVEGCRVLDLGSGTGRDCFLLGKLTGPKGHVIGVDMTPAMIEKSTGFIGYHAEKFGFKNVEFKHGFLETLDQVGLEKNSFDIIISNCVINLCTDKAVVLKHAFDLLKPGGELCFSDVYSAAPVPEDLRRNEWAWNECFTGALAWQDFQETVKKIGFAGPFVISSHDYKAVDPKLDELLRGVVFWSKTCRLFKVDTTGSGGAAKLKYRGTIPGCEERFTFNQDLEFKKDEIVEVPAEVGEVITASRFKPHFLEVK